MSTDTILSIAAFAFVASATPGPNNMMLLASGVNFGFLRTIPHMIGIAVGFASLQLAIGFGIGALIAQFPAVALGLKIAGGLYLLYLSYKIAMSRSVGNGKSDGSPMSFYAAALFQWVNPKAWMMTVGAMTIFANPQMPYISVITVTTVFAVLCIFSISCWAGFGVALQGFLSDPKRLKWFNIATGTILALCIVEMIR